MAKSPNGSDELPVVQKILQTTRQKEGEGLRCNDGENSPRSNFRAPTVQMFISVSPDDRKKQSMLAKVKR
jgi:hypothetical protein